MREVGKPSFYNRPSTSKKKDYIAFINLILKMYPNLRLNENSTLARLALNQYSDILNIPNTNRPPVPDWLCGSIPLGSVQTRLSEYEKLLQGATTITIPFSTELSSIEVSSARYAPDACLAIGLPGTMNYATCEGISIDVEMDFDNFDIANSFYPVDAFAEQITAAEADVGEAAGVGACVGGVNFGNGDETCEFDEIEGFSEDAIEGYTETVSLNASLNGGSIGLSYDATKTAHWEHWGDENISGNIWVVAYKKKSVDVGDYNAVSIEWLRPGQKSFPTRIISGYGVLAGFCPINDNKYGFFISGLCRNGVHGTKERSNISWVTWKGGASPLSTDTESTTSEE